MAFHLATLALEEIGRRALIGLHALSARRNDPPAWTTRHTLDHVKKLFWAFFSANFLDDKLTREKLDTMIGYAKSIHEQRLTGLYVGLDDGQLKIPANAITGEQCEALIDLASKRLDVARSEELRRSFTHDEIQMQHWFLNTADDPEKRQFIFSKNSLKKLAELKNSSSWVRWLKSEFEKIDEESRRLAERELLRSKNLPERPSRDKWKFRIRILSDSHTIRPKAIAIWNDKVDWIKLVYAKKSEVIVEIIVGDHVPIEALWGGGWHIARQFVMALNMGSMGFWWWRLPTQISRFYESLHDLENEAELAVDRNPRLKVDWGRNRVLTDEDLNRVIRCFAALSGLEEGESAAPYQYYLGGLTFLSLNDIHWQCEKTAFVNFYRSLQGMMREGGYWQEGTRFSDSFIRFLDEIWPAFEDREVYARISRALDDERLADDVVTLKEVAVMKLACDAYFNGPLSSIRLGRIEEPGPEE